MKTLTIISAIILNSFAGFSQNVCATSFKRNNGNGTCSAAGQLRITFPGGCPAEVPFIDSIYVEGTKFNVTFAAPDISTCGGTSGYIGYCVTSGNMPPVDVLKIFFRTASGFTFSCTVLDGSINILPIKIPSFEATGLGNAISCKWTTEEESNNHSFELQRSFDGINFSSIANFAVPANETVKRNSYSYIDEAAALQNKIMVYYRIKQVDNNGKATYSKIITVKRSQNNANNILTSPNPFTEAVTLTLNAAENTNADIKMVNLTGQIIATKHFNLSKGMNRLSITELGSLSKGIYVLQVAINGVSIGNNKLIKN